MADLTIFCWITLAVQATNEEKNDDDDSKDSFYMELGFLLFS